MEPLIPVHSSDHVFEALANDRQANPQQHLLLVADENTNPACGQPVPEAPVAAGLDATQVILTRVILSGQPWVSADESSIAEVLQALVAVGSGTVTDMSRFVAFQTRLPFSSISTAPLVDAYTAHTAAIAICERMYSSPMLCAAPQWMIASGFADLVAKNTPLADRKPAHLLVDEALDETAVRQAEAAVQSFIPQTEAVRAAEPSGITPATGLRTWSAIIPGAVLLISRRNIYSHFEYPYIISLISLSLNRFRGL
jgi:glycerol-1-phosphate dehydrogenase [NAD(P)+]